MKRYLTPETAAALSHTHDWILADVALPDGEECTVYRCACGGRRMVWEFDERPRSTPDMPTDFDLFYEANNPANMLRGFFIGVAFIAVLTGIAWLITGHFWPQ